MARLGEILLSKKVLTSNELDSALEHQLMYGIKLGTCLIEMGYVTDEDLARCVGEQMGLAYMTNDQLLAFGSQNLSLISPTVMKKHRLIPVGINGGALRIATDQVFSQNKQIEIEDLLKQKIDLVAVSGYALDCFLENVFGTERPGRFLSRFRKKTTKTASTVVEKASEQAAPIIIDGIKWETLDKVTQKEKPDEVYDELFDWMVNRNFVPLTLSDTAERLSLARSRDDVAKAVLDFLSNSAGTAALVVINDGVVRGWKACVNRKNLQDFEAFSSPIDTLPDLQQSVIMKKPFLGNSMTAETKLLLQMLQFAGGRLACFPIFLQEQVRAVLLCEESEKLNPKETAELCRKTSYALEILILRSKLLCS
jgi:Type II secretion system (T2SS), protein E, N-terminal domain